jgi:lysine 2,3-aminomutase
MTAETLRSAADLISARLIEPEERDSIDRVARRYAVAVTRDMARLIDRGDPHDPIARQFIPQASELVETADERSDPTGDRAHSPVKGIVHRYSDRVLLKPLHACPVYCRFCFRRESVGPGGERLTPAELDAALDYIRAHPEIWEVILSGGDPLLLSPRRLGAIVRALDRIPHVAVIRIHSRIPIVDSNRVSAGLLEAMAAEKALYLVVHANHPRELAAAQRDACARLAKAGISLLGQTVLLKGVNDDAAVLEALFRAMVAARIKPYYLHQADLAPGTSHFRTGLGKGQRLVAALRGRVSGLCQPTYVLDIPGGYGKVPVGPIYAQEEPEAGGWRVRDPKGRIHSYPEIDA